MCLLNISVSCLGRTSREALKMTAGRCFLRIVSVSILSFKPKKLALSGLSGKVIYWKDMGSWKPTAQAGRNEQLGSQNHTQSSPDSTPQLPGCHCYHGDHMLLRCHRQQDESPGTRFFQSVTPESQGCAPSEGDRQTGLEPLASLLDGEPCLPPRFIE